MKTIPNLGLQDQGTNIFGGKNAHGLYVPMSEDEQEAILRLVETQDLVLVVVGWATIENPKVLVGDHRVGIQFRVDFTRLEKVTPIWFFDLELRTQAGEILIRNRLASVYNGQPIQVRNGMFLDLQWDVALHSIDPKFLKSIKPGAIGLTSRRQDRDTGLMTAQGNMVLDANQKAALAMLEEAQAKTRLEDEMRGKRALLASKALG